ncbi:nuclear transport factor 2 family protein [Mucilaginibacter sp. RT5R15]|nr:nuclear transport factor 2 family protein [Mucilaginibacter flavidus]
MELDSQSVNNITIMKILKLSTLLTSLILTTISLAVSAQSKETYAYKPESQELYNTIAHMDSVYFNAYNTCDMDKQAAIYADSIEFYHDKGGLQTSKQALLDALKKNICGKVTRVLVPGSIEVYPIAGFGAVEVGLHRFINHQESETPSKPDKFIVVWRLRNGIWQITRVISLH